MATRKASRSDEDVAAGCAVGFLCIWFMVLLAVLGFWASVIYLIIKLAGSL